jgi:hypothetical protein
VWSPREGSNELHAYRHLACRLDRPVYGGWVSDRRWQRRPDCPHHRAATNLFSYWNADKLVLSMHDAQEVDERSAPELVAIVRELAQRAGLPMPRVYVMDSPQPNAFAVEGAVYSPDGMTIQFDRGSVWVRNVEPPPPPPPARVRG